MSMSSTGTDFGNKTEQDLAAWRRRIDDSKNKSDAKKEYLLQL
jgi:hypothetical protein